MDILNKSYKRKNAPDSDIFHAQRIDGEFVMFANGAKCKLSTLVADFEEVTGVLAPVAQEETVIDPEKFFEAKMTENDPLIMQAEKIKLENAVIPSSGKLQESVSLDDNKTYEKVGPGSKSQANAFASRLDTSEQGSNSEQPVQQSNGVRLPEWDIFDRVKKVEDVEITVTFKMKLPKAEKIDALNDMFETSFISYLAKQYIKDNVVNNSAGLQLTLTRELEAWMESELSGESNTNARKRKKKKPLKKLQPAEPVKTTTIESSESASAFFGAPQPTWDGNIGKLALINTKEQYEAVKKQLASLRENNPKSNEIDRLDGMVELYEMQVDEVEGNKQ